MTARCLGVLLIFSAGVLLLLQLRRRSREEILFLQDMAAALEQAETSVRFRSPCRRSLPTSPEENTAAGSFRRPPKS